MTILINKNPIDVSIENEKTIGEFIEGITAYLQKEKLLIQSITCNGNEIEDSTLSSPLNESDCYEFSVVPYHHYLTYQTQFFLTTINELNTNPINDKQKRQLLELLDLIGNSVAMNQLDSYKALFESESQPPKEELLKLAKELNLILEDIKAPYQQLIKIKEKFKTFLENSTESLPIIIQKGEIHKALDALTSLLIPCFDSIRRIFSLLKDEEAKEIAPFLQEIQPLLSSILESCDNDDRVLLSDIVEYELPPLLEKYINGIEKIEEILS